MTLISACGLPRLGIELMFSDIKVFMGKESPYRNLRVIPHLDHAFPWIDGDILEDYAGEFASVMCDASEMPFEENIRLTAQYVEKVKGKVVVEGAVDEIFEASGAGQKNEPTSVEQAKRFLCETGVDIIVPNVGTEHRSTADKVVYLSDRAREISAAVGKRLCLHGASSVKSEELRKLPEDGFVKINIYTTLAVSGGQALARNVFLNVGNIFSENELKELIDKGVLGAQVLKPGYGGTVSPVKPKLEYVTNPKRRDAWFDTVKNRCKEFLKIFNYERYAK
jgi:fructose/tagatose bisphosphate aldolase